jgi:hypothetical protein
MNRPEAVIRQAAPRLFRAQNILCLGATAALFSLSALFAAGAGVDYSYAQGLDNKRDETAQEKVSATDSRREARNFVIAAMAAAGAGFGALRACKKDRSRINRLG